MYGVRSTIFRARKVFNASTMAADVISAGSPVAAAILCRMSASIALLYVETAVQLKAISPTPAWPRRRAASSTFCAMARSSASELPRSGRRVA